MATPVRPWTRSGDKPAQTTSYWGSYIALGEQGGRKLRVDLKLQDSENGETVAAIAEEGTEAELSLLVRDLGARLREKLGAGQVTSQEAAAISAALPSTTDALRLYSEGLARLRVYDGRGALDLLQKAVSAEPDYALAHLALSDAWRFVGNTKAMQEEAKKAVDLSSRLSSEDRLWIEATYDDVSNNDDKALQAYKTLFAQHPDNLEYGLRLAGAQKQKEALVTLNSLRALPTPAGDDPRIDLEEARALLKETPAKALAAAERAMTKAQARGDRNVVASALNIMGIAALDAHRDAIAYYLKSKDIYAALGDRNHVAMVNGNMSNDLRKTGDLEGARKLLEESLSIHREIGNTDMLASGLANLSDLFMHQGKFRDAAEGFKEELSIERKLNEKDWQAYTLERLGEALRQQGDLSGARMYFAQSLAVSRQLSDKDQLASNLLDAAKRELDNGNLPGSRRLIDEAASTVKESTDKMLRNQVLRVSGDLLLEENQLEEARKDYNERLSNLLGMGREHAVAFARLQLGRIALEQGNPEFAVSTAVNAKELGHKNADNDLESEANQVLSSGLFEQGKYPEAAKELENAQQIRHKLSPGLPDFDNGILAARLDAVSGRFDSAEKSLNELLKLAVKTGSVRQEYRIRLALGEIEVKSGDPKTGRARLTALEKDARSKGFLLIARKAATAMADESRSKISSPSGKTPTPTSPS